MSTIEKLFNLIKNSVNKAEDSFSEFYINIRYDGIPRIIDRIVDNCAESVLYIKTALLAILDTVKMGWPLILFAIGLNLIYKKLRSNKNDR